MKSDKTIADLAKETKELCYEMLKRTESENKMPDYAKRIKKRLEERRILNGISNIPSRTN